MLPVTIAGEVIAFDSYVARPERAGRFPLIILVHRTPDVEGAAFRDALKQRTPVGRGQVAVAFGEHMRRGFGRSGGSYTERLPQPCHYLAATSLLPAVPL